MLSDKERREIEQAVHHVPMPRAACIDALNIVQRQRGWVSDEAVAEIADLLGMSPAEVDSVATFYSLIFRRPVGRHILLLCDSVTCWSLGCETLRRHIQARLGIDFGQTSADGAVTLLPVACLGACDRGPALMLDGILYGHLDTERIDELLARLRLAEEPWNDR